MGRHHDRKYGQGSYGMQPTGTSWGTMAGLGLVPIIAIGGISIGLLTLFKHKIWSAGTYVASTASNVTINY
jgi:hypothetical protein